MLLYTPSQTFKAVLVRATASFTYLFIFSMLPREWWCMCLMWMGLVLLKWTESRFPWNSTCPAKCPKR